MIEKQVLIIALYGSFARADSDNESDVDVMVIVSDRSTEVSEESLRVLAPSLPSLPLEVSVYTQSEFDLMLSCGSLFLWHVKLEGRIVYGNDYCEKCFEELQPYRNHHEELSGYKDILSDLILAYAGYSTPNEFDLAVIYTVARNTCIVLSHWIGQPSFGRRNSIEAVQNYFRKFHLDEKDIVDLSEWKNAYERGANLKKKLPSVPEMDGLINATMNLVELGLEKTYTN